MPTTDPVGTALAGIGAGAASGAAIVTTGALALRLLQAGGAGELTTEIGSFLLGGSAFAGMIVAVATGWIRTRAINDPWRRAVTGAVAAFGAVLLALGATVADMVAGPFGMGCYLIALVAAAVVAHRAARQAASR